MSRNRYIRFLVLAGIIFLVLQRLYIEVREDHERFLNDGLNGTVSAAVINILTPERRVEILDGQLIGIKASVDIRKGCEGFEVMILLLSVLAAYPMMSWRYRWGGILIGCVLIYTLNILRIVSLFYISYYRPEWFEAAHVSWWQTAIILFAGLFFMLWIHLAGRDGQEKAGTAASPS